MPKKSELKKPKKKAPSRPNRPKVYGLKKHLDDRELRFANELLSGKSIIQAAVSAGYTPKTADGKAYRWVGDSRETSAKPLLYDYIAEKRQKMLAKYELTRDKLAGELGKMIFTPLKELYNENGQLKPIHEIPEAALTLIAGIESDEVAVSKNVTTVTKKLKLIKKTEAIAIAAKLMGFNAAEKVEHNAGPSFLEFLMKASAGQTGDKPAGA